MRFDDSLTTVLAGDASTSGGAAAAWRQLVDLVGRGKVPTDVAIERLAGLRPRVPLPARVASARSLAAAMPPALLVGFFAADDPAVAAPVLRGAQLAEGEWLALLPRLSPATRAVLRHRRDLPAAVERGLASFGATDFVLGHDAPPVRTPAPSVPTAALDPSPIGAPMPSPTLVPGPAATPFVPVGQVARALPVVAEALRQAAEPPRSDIADLVARIDAFRRDRPVVAVAASPAPPPSSAFRFATDPHGVIRWVDGVARGPLVGLDLRRAAASAATAIRAREPFRIEALVVGGESTAGGRWRLDGVPSFDRATGRFDGFVGRARRVGEPVAPAPATDSLRQLMHELRTPANAIAGFAEMIGSELLGPVPPVYRDRARLVEREAGALIDAIDDLDTAARLRSGALDQRPARVDLRALLGAAAESMERGALTVEAAEAFATVDDRLAAKLLNRLFAVVLAAAAPGERLRVQLATKTRGPRLHVTRPRALVAPGGEALRDIAHGGEGPLLGPAFTLQLVADLAAAMGGSLLVTADRLTLRLPTALTAEMEQAEAH